jgi:hypothetical protein
MNFEIVELEEFSGNKTAIYSIVIDNEALTLFDIFVEENENTFSDEIQSITDRLEIIGKITGAREHYFKINEGSLGDGLCALYDIPEKNLRLYCIKYGSTCILLGGGGFKNVRALQDDEKLKKENYLLRKISKMITKALIDGDLEWSKNGMGFMGNMIINEED